jgi:formate hydrogenlyase subunit 3/multisubunit Na+/H+ antiporter MnhD subunit
MLESQLSFICLGMAGVFAMIAGVGGLISEQAMTAQLPLGLPWLPWHVRFDSLSGLFFLIIGIAIFAVSCYGPGYVKGNNEQEHPFAVLGLFSGLFIAGMLLVLLADDAFFFMISWELMSVASYFLVAFQHENSKGQRGALQATKHVTVPSQPSYQNQLTPKQKIKRAWRKQHYGSLRVCMPLKNPYCSWVYYLTIELQNP